VRWVIAVVFLLGWGCAFDFDGYDPRLSTNAVGGAAAGGAAVGGAAVGGSAPGGSGGEPSGGATSAGGATGGGGMGPVVVEIVAVVADCIDPLVPDPDVCAADQPRATMGVDAEVTPPMMDARHSYLRFDLGELAGRVVSAALEITVSTVSSAGSSSSGEIWQVASFTRSDLFVSTPAPMGQAPIVGDQGAVGQGQTVSFALPTALFGEPSLFFGVLPLSTDGIDYENLDGAVPPKLVVTVE
jgi:hypothetical protein